MCSNLVSEGLSTDRPESLPVCSLLLPSANVSLLEVPIEKMHFSRLITTL